MTYQKLYDLGVSLFSNPWIWGVIGWGLIIYAYPFADVLPVYAE